MAAIDYAGGLFERAKARVFSAAGRFLQTRDQILRMRDVVDAVRRKGDVTARPELADLARSLMQKIDQLYGRQIQLEQRVQAIVGSFTTPGAGAGAMLQTAGAAAPLLKDVGVHMASVKAAQAAVDALKRRTLTAAELAAIGRPGAFAGGLGIAAVAALGIGAWWFFGRRRR